MIIHTIIKTSEKGKIIHHKGTTTYQGCQCFKDCDCRESFIGEMLEYYTVKRKDKPTKTCATLQEAETIFHNL